MTMEPASVVVVGSANADLHLTVGGLPRAGETVLADETDWLPGGKGANQALAAALLGGDVTLVAAVGDDQMAAVALDGLEEAGVHLALRRLPGAPTGVAVVCVDHDGENLIVAAPGANGQLQPGDVVVPDSTGAVLVSLEIPVETAAAAMRAAHDVGALAVLNAAPAAGVTPELLDDADIVIANEGEASALADGGTLADLAASTRTTVVATRGPAGAVAVTPDGGEHNTPGRPVEVIDTVGAGDCFAAAFTVALAERRSLQAALAFANTAASLKVGRRGARSMPTRFEVSEKTD
jgi:ribokinase